MGEMTLLIRHIKTCKINTFNGYRKSIDMPRKKGSRSIRTISREVRTRNTIDRVADELGEQAFRGDAHAFLVSVYQDKSRQLPIRMQAASACLPYERPKMMAVAHGTLQDARQMMVEATLTDVLRTQDQRDQLRQLLVSVQATKGTPNGSVIDVEDNEVRDGEVEGATLGEDEEDKVHSMDPGGCRDNQSEEV